MPFSRYSYLKRSALRWVHTFGAWLASGGISCLFHVLPLGRRRSRIYFSHMFGFRNCLCRIRATWAADEGALDVHRSLRTHPLHWAQPQQMAWHCGAEFGRVSMWLGGALLCLRTLGMGCFWGAHRSMCRNSPSLWVNCSIGVCLGCCVVKIHSEIISIDQGSCISSLLLWSLTVSWFLCSLLFSTLLLSLHSFHHDLPPTAPCFVHPPCVIFCVSTCIAFYHGPYPPPAAAAPPNITIPVMITWNLFTLPSTHLPICTYTLPPHSPTSSPSPTKIPSSPPASPLPDPSSPHPWEGWDGGPQQQDSEDHRLWAGSRVAPHHQDERRRHLRLDGSRSHPLVYILQG